MNRAIVVGAGMGGLASALALACQGHDVTVLEAGPRAGGKAGIVEIDGLSCDTGPSVVTLPEVFDQLFALAGTSLADEVRLTRPDPATRYLDPEFGAYDVRATLPDTLDSVADALGGEAAGELRDFLAYAEQIWTASAPHFVLGPAPTPDRLWRLPPSAWCSLPRIDPMRSMDAAIAKRVRHPAIRRLLRRFATYNGSDPRVAPATLHCIAWIELGLGIHGVVGGIEALVDAIVRVAQARGVSFHYDTPVASLQIAGGRVVRAITAHGDAHEADAFVVNADAAHLVADLLAPQTRHGLHIGPPSMSGWNAIVRTRIRPQRAAHTVLFPADYTAEFADIFDRDRAPREPTVYQCAPCKAHARSPWRDGCEPLFVMANCPPEPPGSPRDPEMFNTLSAELIRRLREHDLIDSDDRIEWSRTPTVLANTFPGTRGAIYGAASNDRFAAFRRPPNRVRAIGGLYLASGSAHPGGGLPLCALSGLAAANAIAQDNG